MPHTSQTQQETVVSALYDAALDAGAWPGALARLTDWTDADAVMLVVADGGARRVLMQHGHDDEYLAEYRHDWLADDPRLAPVAGVDARRRERRLAELRAWQTTHGFAASFADRLYEDNGAVTWLLVSSREDESLGRIAIRYGRVREHVQRALRLGRREADLAQRNATLSRIIDDCPLGMMLLERDGRLHHANARAWGMLAREDALHLREGELHALREGDDQRLQALLHGDAGASTGDSTGWLALARGGGEPAYMLTVRKVPPSGDDPAPLGDTKLLQVFIGDACDTPVIGSRAMGALFDLTRREAQVCARLLGGRGVEEMAADLGISPRTARVYLQQVYAKVGVHRQADLVRVLMSCPGAPAAAPAPLPGAHAPVFRASPPPVRLDSDAASAP